MSGNHRELAYKVAPIAYYDCRLTVRNLYATTQGFQAGELSADYRYMTYVCLSYNIIKYIYRP